MKRATENHGFHVFFKMTQVTFITISFLSLLLLYLGTGRNKKVLTIFIIWQIIIGVIATLHVFEKNPSLFPLVISGTIVLTFLALKQTDRQLLNPTILILILTLRIPVELVLYQLFLQHKIPSLMTFTGWNFDILIGISALIIFLYQFLSKRKISRYISISWNIIGIISLLFIVSVAILSSPLPVQQFAFDQPNTAVLEFPYCFLPTCVVPIVFMSHILLINNLKNAATDNEPDQSIHFH